MKTNKLSTPRSRSAKRTSTGADIAAAFNVGAATLARWRSAGLASDHRGGAYTYNAGEVGNFLRANPNLGTPGRKALPEGDALKAVQLRKDEALAVKYEVQGALARLDQMEREQSLIPRDQARIALGRIASIIRNCGETLQRQFGPAALEVLNEAIDDAQQETDRAFGAIDPGANGQGQEPGR